MAAEEWVDVGGRKWGKENRFITELQSDAGGNDASSQGPTARFLNTSCKATNHDGTSGYKALG